MMQYPSSIATRSTMLLAALAILAFMPSCDGKSASDADEDGDAVDHVEGGEDAREAPDHEGEAPDVEEEAADPCNGLDDDHDGVCDGGFDCCAGAVEERPCEGCPDMGSSRRTCDGDCTWGRWDSFCDADLPRVDVFASSSTDRIRALVVRAMEGLGFPPGGNQGPLPCDRIFVGTKIMAWIDQTGFQGEMNGMWRLNGDDSEGLDFVLTDPGGRPVNFLRPAEDGDGRWAPGYSGGEHIEFPNLTPEPGSDTGCRDTWCAQYALNEAQSITHPDIEWWRACNAGGPAWTDTFFPVVDQPLSGGEPGIKLVYEAPLVKEAGSDAWCHEDFLFPDMAREQVNLRVGYQLYGSRSYVERTMQIVNTSGKFFPAPEGTEGAYRSGYPSIIGGFDITSYPGQHYLKRLNRYFRPEEVGRDLEDPYHGDTVILYGGQWNAHLFDPVARDEELAWMYQPITLSVIDGIATGRTATLSHLGPGDNDDTGVCLCNSHDGLDMGGGLLHWGYSLPLAPGGSTDEAVRRLDLPDGEILPVTGFTYEAESDLQHNVGSADAEGWSATTGGSAEGWLAFGPYVTDWGDGSAQAVFIMMVDNVDLDDSVVVTVDINDNDGGGILASRDVRRSEFHQPYLYQRFALDFDLKDSGGHLMEARVYWRDTSYVRLDKVLVFVADPG